MKTIRWGIIGCGNVCEVKSGPGFQKARNSELVAVMRRNGAAARDFARRHGVPHACDDAGELLANPEVDAVYVATPPGSHRDYALRAAAAGKIVYVEKPMARTHAECLEMIAACREASVPLYVGFYRRRHPRFMKIRELVEGGAIGDVRLVSVLLHQPPAADDLQPAHLPWRVQPEHAGGGRFYDLASHTLDILDYILGPISETRGVAANQAGNYAAEDAVAGAWQHASGALGCGGWSFSAGAHADVNQIVGSMGRVIFSTFGNEPVLLATAAGEEAFPFDPEPHVHQPLIQSIVDELNGSGKCPSTGESGARTSWVLEALAAR